MKNTAFWIKIMIALGMWTLAAAPLAALAAQVAFQWDPNSASPEGYRLFQRRQGQTYNYASPAWHGTATTCTITGLVDGTTYYFVVRAFAGESESGDSNEVSFTPAAAPQPALDSDGDGVVDTLDAFPSDPNEWADTDEDGIGNNSDGDDDNDGLPDAWEIQHGLDPLKNDASGDLDGDGIGNLQEYLNGSDPAQVNGNTAPDAPEPMDPADGQVVDLSPMLSLGPYADADGDSHGRSRFQISTSADFSGLVFDMATAKNLTAYEVPALILDAGTVYYWRAKYIDIHGGQSEWSQIRSFTTIGYNESGDADGNGIPDGREADSSVDLDADGTPDIAQNGMLCVSTSDSRNPYISVKSLSSQVQVVSLDALEDDVISRPLNHPMHMMGLIGFKLYLAEGATTASVVVYLSSPAPAKAQWYKYDDENGWTVYPNAVLAPDGRSVTLMLEDGGSGDQDGTVNGVIVDPSGVGYEIDSSNGETYVSGSGDAGGCFISIIR